VRCRGKAARAFPLSGKRGSSEGTLLRAERRRKSLVFTNARAGKSTDEDRGK